MCSIFRGDIFGGHTGNIDRIILIHPFNSVGVKKYKMLIIRHIGCRIEWRQQTVGWFLPYKESSGKYIETVELCQLAN